MPKITRSKKQSSQKKPRILIVEDDTFLAGIYASKFESAGFAVTLVTDGEAGLKMAEKEIPDAILLDVLLPKKDGFEVLEGIKRNTATHSVPVLLLTNLGQREDVERGLKLGASDYLIKAHFLPHETVDKGKRVLAAAKGK